jgi:hypothetical protein
VVAKWASYPVFLFARITAALQCISTQEYHWQREARHVMSDLSPPRMPAHCTFPLLQRTPAIIRSHAPRPRGADYRLFDGHPGRPRGPLLIGTPVALCSQAWAGEHIAQRPVRKSDLGLAHAFPARATEGQRDAAKRAPGQAGAAGAAGAAGVAAALANLNVDMNPVGDWTTQARDRYDLFAAIGGEMVKRRADAGDRQGLTLVHFSAQLEPCLTQ